MDELKLFKVTCDEAYYNQGKPKITDQEYDLLKDTLEEKGIKSGVGILPTEKKVKLPVNLGSLTKITKDEKLVKWGAKFKQNKGFWAMEKLDGVSCLVMNGKVYTRGDGTFGQDITHHFPKLPLLYPNSRGELIIKKEHSDKFGAYSTLRNATTGLINSDSSKPLLKFVDYVPYEIIGESLYEKQREKFHNWVKDKFICELLLEELKDLLQLFKKESLYECDGIVVITNEKYQRNTSENPKYAFAFKINEEEKQRVTTVIDVEWNISKWGLLKPRVKVKPVEIDGVTIQWCTGFNAKFIQENKIGTGAEIVVIRSGEVIPFILKVIKPAKVILPCENWNSTKVDLLADCNEEKQIYHFFVSINCKGFGPAVVKKLYENGFKNIHQILKMTIADFLTLPGVKVTSATKLQQEMQHRLEDASLSDLMVASSCFGAGFGKKKCVSITSELPDFLDLKNPEAELEKIKGFKNTRVICEGITPFKKHFLKYLNKKPAEPILELVGHKFAMTGFRSKELIDSLISKGHEYSETVTRNTNFLIVKDTNQTSAKMKTAEKYQVKIISSKEVEQYF